MWYLAYNYIVTNSFLNDTFSDRVTGRSFTERPLQSQYLTVMDIFLWGTMKDKVHMKKPLNINQLWEYI